MAIRAGRHQGNSAARGIEATLPVPMDWPEQTIKKISEEKTPNVHGVTFKTLDGGVRQMVVSVPRLPAGDEASAVVTFESPNDVLSHPSIPRSFACHPSPAASLENSLPRVPLSKAKTPKSNRWPPS